MKPYFPFVVSILSGGLLFYLNQKSEQLDSFIFHGHLYDCEEKETFFVGLPENCQICPNKQTKYVNWNGKSIWACSSLPIENEEELLIPVFPLYDCPSNMPLKDILGHCYSCQTPQPVQIDETEKSTCQGKRYLTEYRQSLKSNLCPDLPSIQNPEICLNCQGNWINEKCVRLTFSTMSLCKNNSDCSDNYWCQPIYNSPTYKGICRPSTNQNWIYSDLEGYSNHTADVFCARQNAHIPTLKELENEKNEVLAICSKTNIWIVFDEGRLYLDSLKTPFIITDERTSSSFGGDNTYALCRKD